MATWQLCPKCNGQGQITKPPYIPGDIHEWSSSATTFTCDVCNGAKILATPGNQSTCTIPENVNTAAKGYADGFYPIKDYSCYESDYDYRTQVAKNEQVQEHYKAGAAHIQKQGDINDFPVTKELKWKVTQLIVADMSQLVGLDLTDRQMGDYQDKHAGELIDEILDAVLAWQQSKKPNTYAPIPSSIVRPKWVKATDRLPVKPDNYPYKYSDEDEPGIIFKNDKHSASVIFYLSIGYSAKEMLDQYNSPSYDEGWTIENWFWLDENAIVPTIPTGVIKHLEEHNPYPDIEDLPFEPASAKTGYNFCVSKLKELLSAQPVSDDAAEKEVMIQAFDKVRKLFELRSWIMEGRGSYRYDDDRYKEEVRYLYDEFDQLQKDTWANIKSKSVDFRKQVVADYLATQPAEQGEGVELIRQERIRQIQKEGWDKFHDDHHGNMELTGAACCYASSAINKYFKENKVRFEIHLPAETSMEAGNTGDRGDRRLRPAGWFDAWPWDKESDKREKHDILRSLVIAGALIASEIDRLTTPKPDNKEEKK